MLIINSLKRAIKTIDHQQLILQLSKGGEWCLPLKDAAGALRAEGIGKKAGTEESIEVTGRTSSLKTSDGQYLSLDTQ